MEKKEDTSDTKLRTDFKNTLYQHKWLVSHLTSSEKLDTLQSDFTPGEARSGGDVSYRAEVGLSSAA